MTLLALLTAFVAGVATALQVAVRVARVREIAGEEGAKKVQKMEPVRAAVDEMSDTEIEVNEAAQKAMSVERCKLFPDGIHTYQLSDNTNLNFVRLIKCCPCGAMVSTIRLQRGPFLSGMIPTLVPYEPGKKSQ